MFSIKIFFIDDKTFTSHTERKIFFGRYLVAEKNKFVPPHV